MREKIKTQNRIRIFHMKQPNKMTEQTETQTPEQWPVRFTQNSIRTIFILFTVFWWVGYPLIFVFIGIPFLIAAIVFDCIILYRHWWLLQGHGARTTPGKAVGFSFIPLFNFYWWFVAYAGLAKDNNAYMDKVGIQGTRVSHGLALSVCILGIISNTVGLIPYVGFVLAIPGAILGFLFVLQQKNAILAIMDNREKSTEQVAGEQPVAASNQ
jgi:hypothetical protein